MNLCVYVFPPVRLLVDAQDDPHYQSWFSKVQAALKHCCGKALRQELERETRLVTLLTQVAERVRKADKNRRKVCTVMSSVHCQLGNMSFSFYTT